MSISLFAVKLLKVVNAEMEVQLAMEQDRPGQIGDDCF